MVPEDNAPEDNAPEDNAPEIGRSPRLSVRRNPAGRPAGTHPFILLSVSGGSVRDGDDLAGALAAVGRVHGVTGLDSVPVQLERIGHQHVLDGALNLDRELRPVSISIDLRGDHRRLTLVHEFAHLLDLAAFDVKGRFASAHSSLLGEWREAAGASRAVEQLSDIADGVEQPLIYRERVATYLRIEEVFARSYAQYVAVVDGRAPLLRQVAGLASGTKPAVHKLRVWEDGDFTQIAWAFDNLFKRLEWVK